MNKATREALEGSIRKWRAIVKGTGVDGGSDNCPLCQMFISRECLGCPVAEVTHRIDCDGSPYMAAARLMEKVDPDQVPFHPRRAVTKEAKELAQAELDFLISLRPKKGK